MNQFSEQLSDMKSKRVKLWRGGPDSVEGYLLDVKKDYLTLYRDDGRIVHYPFHHLKSVTLSTENVETDTPPEYLPVHLVQSTAETFYDLMQAHVGTKVNINGHGPESISGFLFECGSDYIRLITTPDEMVSSPLFHIRSMSAMVFRHRNAGEPAVEEAGNQSNSTNTSNDTKKEKKQEMNQGKKQEKNKEKKQAMNQGKKQDKNKEKKQKK